MTPISVFNEHFYWIFLAQKCVAFKYVIERKCSNHLYRDLATKSMKSILVPVFYVVEKNF